MPHLTGFTFSLLRIVGCWGSGAKCTKSKGIFRVEWPGNYNVYYLWKRIIKIRMVYERPETFEKRGLDFYNFQGLFIVLCHCWPKRHCHRSFITANTYFAFVACTLKYISLLPVKRNCMNPVGPSPVGQSTALKLISHNPLPLWGGRSARSPDNYKDKRQFLLL